MTYPDGGDPREAAARALESYLTERSDDLDWQQVEEWFWFVRVPGTARSWIPIEITVGDRTVRAVSYFAIEPEERRADAYRYLLQYNFAGTGVSFSSDKDRAVALVGRIDLPAVTEKAIDELIGKIVDTTETTFQTFLRLGFASRFDTPLRVDGCLSCQINRGEAEPPGGLVHTEAGWRVEHLYGPAPVAGWMIVKPERHVEQMDELTPGEAAALSPLLQRVVAAIRAETGAAKVYVASFGEAVEHLHVHVVPRPDELPQDRRGPGIFDLLTVARESGGVPESECARLAGRIRVRLFEPR